MAQRTASASERRIPSPESRSIVILRARFNEHITDALQDGAVKTLREGGVPAEQIHTFDVPGSFELPQAANRLDERMPEPDGIIAIGCVIRGETPHFEYISSTATRGLQDVALEKSYPVIFGVLTCDTREQAKARAGLTDDGTNKGREAARALAQMLQHQQNVEHVEPSTTNHS